MRCRMRCCMQERTMCRSNMRCRIRCDIRYRMFDIRYRMYVRYRMLLCRTCLTYDIDIRCRTCTTYDIVRVLYRTCLTYDIVCNIGIIRCRTSDVRHRTSARIQMTYTKLSLHTLAATRTYGLHSTELARWHHDIMTWMLHTGAKKRSYIRSINVSLLLD
jgi:hypothetical protein